MPPIVALISAIAIFIVVLVLFLAHDLSKWKNNYTPVDHGGKKVLRRLPFQIPSIVGFAVYAKTFWAAPISYLMISLAWWILFDGFYNIKRGKKWNYNGSFNDIGHTDAWTDKLLKRMKPWQQVLLKWGLLAGSIVAYCLSIKSKT